MSLGLAFQKAIPSMQQRSVDYKQGVVAVSTLMMTISSSSLPTLNSAPQDWQAFVATFDQAKTAALSWANGALSQLLVIPQSVEGSNAIISGLLATAASDMQTLQANPSDKATLAVLAANLATLQKEFTRVGQIVRETMGALETFGNAMFGLGPQLRQLADQATHDAAVDQAMIDRMNEEVSALQAHIDSRSSQLAGFGIASGLGLTLGLVATVAAGPLAWLVAGPVVAVSATEIAMDSTEMKSDHEQIVQLQSQMSGLTGDVSALHILATTFNNFTAQVTALRNSLGLILGMWGALNDDIDSTLRALQEMGDGSQRPPFMEGLYLQEASTQWQECFAEVGLLSIELKANTAMLTVGMDAGQVSSALAKGRVVGIMEYFNRGRPQPKGV